MLVLFSSFSRTAWIIHRSSNFLHFAISFRVLCFWPSELIHSPCYCKQQVSPTISYFKTKPNEMWWCFSSTDVWSGRLCGNKETSINDKAWSLQQLDWLCNYSPHECRVRFLYSPIKWPGCIAWWVIWAFKVYNIQQNKVFNFGYVGWIWITLCVVGLGEQMRTLECYLLML